MEKLKISELKFRDRFYCFGYSVLYELIGEDENGLFIAETIATNASHFHQRKFNPDYIVSPTGVTLERIAGEDDAALFLRNQDRVGGDYDGQGQMV